MIYKLKDLLGHNIIKVRNISTYRKNIYSFSKKLGYHNQQKHYLLYSKIQKSFSTNDHQNYKNIQDLVNTFHKQKQRDDNFELKILNQIQSIQEQIKQSDIRQISQILFILSRIRSKQQEEKIKKLITSFLQDNEIKQGLLNNSQIVYILITCSKYKCFYEKALTVAQEFDFNHSHLSDFVNDSFLLSIEKIITDIKKKQIQVSLKKSFYNLISDNYRPFWENHFLKVLTQDENQITRLSITLAKLEIRDFKIWNAILEYFEENHKNLTPQNKGAIFSSILLSKAYNYSSILRIFDLFLDNIEQLSPEQFSKMFRSIVNQLDHQFKKLPVLQNIQIIESYIQQNISKFSLFDVSNIIMQFAILNYKNEQIISLLLNQFLDNYHQKSPVQHRLEYISAINWSLFVFDQEIPQEIQQIYLNLLKQIKFEHLNPFHIQQNIVGLYKLTQIQNDQRFDQYYQKFLQFLITKNQKRVDKSFKKKEINNELSFDLESFCKALNLEILREQFYLFYSLDYYVPKFFEINFENIDLNNILNAYKNELRNKVEEKSKIREINDSFGKNEGIFIEIDGPSHFIDQQQKLIKGRSVIKKKVLEKENLKVLYINSNQLFEIMQQESELDKMDSIINIFKKFQKQYKN